VEQLASTATAERDDAHRIAQIRRSPVYKIIHELVTLCALPWSL
jgi:hypothetical protein